VLPLADIWHWRPSPEHWLVELLAGGAILVAGIAAFIPLRHLIHRTRLRSAYIVLIVSMAIYPAIEVMEPHRDEPTWLSCLFVAAILFVAVKIFDRLMLVPALSRGGTVTVPRFIRQIILIIVMLFVVLMYGKHYFNWPISDFLTGGAVISVVIGLALQESLGNLFSGLFMQAAPPFTLGDFIAVGDVEGVVVDMTWRAVTIKTIYDNFVVIPNGTIAKQDILNYHAPDSVTARVIKIGLEYDLPPCDAVEVLQRAALETEGVLPTPAPVAILLDFADSAITYGIKFWISEPKLHVRIEHAVRMHIWYRLKEKGYAIPFPMRTVEHVAIADKTRNQQQASSTVRIAALEGSPLLAPLTADQRRQLADGATTVQLAPGQVLFSQDDPGESFYIIQRGKVDIIVRGAGGALAVLVTLGPGDFFGEMSALTGQPRTATVRAAAPLSLVEIGKQDLQGVVDADHSILEKLSEVIARRNVEREAHVKGLTANAVQAETVKVQQQSLLSRMAAFFRVTPG
jgi:small-conductance mechanosensitive channel/CRP-like cAMP-binding protein